MSPIVEPTDPDRRHRLLEGLSQKTKLLRERASRTDSHQRISPEDAEAALIAAGMKQPRPTDEQPADESAPPPGDGGALTSGQPRPPMTTQDRIAEAEAAGDLDATRRLKLQLLRDRSADQ